jgi:tyrosyl-tRNA synthetase
MKLIQTLASRRLLKDHTNFHPNFTSRKLYCGFDPTADSLHLGHLSTLNALVYGAIVGIQPIALIGTATGMIGDPSGRSTSRPFLSSEQITHNAHKLSTQIPDTYSKLYSRAASHLGLDSSPALEIVYNDSFYKNQSIISFLREVGSLMPISPMLSKEMVKSRIDSLTYTEFSYQLLQAYDFYYLYSSHVT